MQICKWTQGQVSCPVFNGLCKNMAITDANIVIVIDD